MAWFKNSCFLSHRHGQAANERCIRALHEGLAAELSLLRPEGVYVDYGRLTSGDFVEETICHELRESACMVMVYHPTYFDVVHTYCAREYLAMETLERHRLAQLAEARERNHGLIVPLVLRGLESLPQSIKEQRMYEDVSKIVLLDIDGSIREHAVQVRRVAEYIHARCTALGALTRDGAPEGFQLPSDDEARNWVESLRLPQPQFPGSGV